MTSSSLPGHTDEYAAAAKGPFPVRRDALPFDPGEPLRYPVRILPIESSSKERKTTVRFLDLFREKKEAIPNLGRNDLCWCGSGKKYKYCHMTRDERKRSKARALTCKPTG